MTRTLELKDALPEFLLEEILNFSGEGIAIHAGHYILDTSATGMLADHLEMSVAEASGILREFLEFTATTWKAGCDLARRSLEMGRSPSLMVLVNDWQFVSGDGSSRRSRERDADIKRVAYYKKLHKFPDFHLRIMQECGLPESVVLPAKDVRWIFSESELRRGLAKTISELFREGSAEVRGLSKEVTSTGDVIVKIKSELYSEACLLYCGSTNCSGEIVALLKLLWDRGIRLFVNLYPVQCLGPVSAGTEMGRQVFGLGGMKVINVAFPLGATEPRKGAIVDVTGG